MYLLNPRLLPISRAEFFGFDALNAPKKKNASSQRGGSCVEDSVRHNSSGLRVCILDSFERGAC